MPTDTAQIEYECAIKEWREGGYKAQEPSIFESHNNKWIVKWRDEDCCTQDHDCNTKEEAIAYAEKLKEAFKIYPWIRDRS
jgi:hypothetical protein